MTETTTATTKAKTAKHAASSFDSEFRDAKIRHVEYGNAGGIS